MATLSYQMTAIQPTSNPLEVAEYAVCNKIAEQPAFAWWVNTVLRKRDRIIKKAKTVQRWAQHMKYNIQVPRTVQEAYDIDAHTGTTFWRDAIAKEMCQLSNKFGQPQRSEFILV
jgi:Zn-dependent M32 family carboxypeptidase